MTDESTKTDAKIALGSTDENSSQKPPVVNQKYKELKIPDKTDTKKRKRGDGTYANLLGDNSYEDFKLAFIKKRGNITHLASYLEVQPQSIYQMFKNHPEVAQWCSEQREEIKQEDWSVNHAVKDLLLAAAEEGLYRRALYGDMKAIQMIYNSYPDNEMGLTGATKRETETKVTVALDDEMIKADERLKRMREEGVIDVTPVEDDDNYNPYAETIKEGEMQQVKPLPLPQPEDDND